MERGRTGLDKTEGSLMEGLAGLELGGGDKKGDRAA